MRSSAPPWRGRSSRGCRAARTRAGRPVSRRDRVGTRGLGPAWGASLMAIGMPRGRGRSVSKMLVRHAACGLQALQLPESIQPSDGRREECRSISRADIPAHVRSDAAAASQAPAQASASTVSLRDYAAAGDGATDDTFVHRGRIFGGLQRRWWNDPHPGRNLPRQSCRQHRYPICSNLVVHGPGTIKVKPDAGNYRAIFAASPPAAAVNNLTFTGISVDQNTFGNTAATIVVDNVRTHQLIWQVFAGTNLHFENMRLYVSGVNPIDVNGPAVSGVYVNRNYIVFQKRTGSRSSTTVRFTSTATTFMSPTTRSSRRRRTRRAPPSRYTPDPARSPETPSIISPLA